VVATRYAAFTIYSQRSNSTAAGTSRCKGNGTMGGPEKKLHKSIRSLLKTPAFEGRSFKSIMNNEALLRVAHVSSSCFKSWQSTSRPHCWP
jgi:hypothetical protein